MIVRKLMLTIGSAIVLGVAHEIIKWMEDKLETRPPSRKKSA